MSLLDKAYIPHRLLRTGVSATRISDERARNGKGPGDVGEYFALCAAQ